MTMARGLVDWLMKQPPAGKPLDPGYQTVVGSLSSLFVLVPHGGAIIRQGEADWATEIAMLFVAWVVSTLVLARGRETETFALVAKGVGLPSILFALGDYARLGS